MSGDLKGVGKIQQQQQRIHEIKPGDEVVVTVIKI